jgi:hypothetical protein
MNKTILSEIENAKKLYPLVLREISKFYLRIELGYASKKKLLEKLQKITGKNIFIFTITSYLYEYSGETFIEEQNLSFKISMPEPKIIENISQKEIYEIYEIVKKENYRNNANDAIEWIFFRHFNDYFQAILEINFQYLLDTTV